MFHDVWLLLVTCLLMLVQTVHANWDRVCTPFTRDRGPHSRGICGRRIDETLDLLCVDGYNEYPSSNNNFRKKRDTNKDLAETMGNFLIGREDANSYLSRHKRSNYYSRGIVCECCYHKCTLLELFSYCQNEPSIYNLFKRSTARQMRSRSHQANG